MNTVQEQEKLLAKKLAEARIKLGSLQQKKIAFDEKVAKRNELLNKALKTWDIPQNDSELTEKGKKLFKLIQVSSKMVMKYSLVI